MPRVFRFLVVFVLIALLVGGVVAARRLPTRRAYALAAAASASASPTPSPTPTLTPSPAPTATATPTPTPSPEPAAPQNLSFPAGTVVFAMREGLHSQLFAYNPSSLPLTRLTNEDFDHADPAFSPNGGTLAYAVHRRHGWDIALTNLSTGATAFLTDDAAYDGAPSWSPDGKWIAYEHYANLNLDICIRDSAASQKPIRLTRDAGADFAPAWSPQGRLIAFVSTRTGSPQVFIANLDKAGADRFLQISHQGGGAARHPAWSPDGRYLAWSQTSDGVPTIFVWDTRSPSEPPRRIGEGWWPLWADGRTLLAVVRRANGRYFTAYDVQSNLVLPAVPLPMPVEGFAYTPQAVKLPASWAANGRITPTPVWTPHVTPLKVPAGRIGTVPLRGVQAPHPALSDAADEAFAALRAALRARAGWDVLASLDNAFVPLTSPLPLGLQQDWLYTGRAIVLSTAPLNSGWMAVEREDLGNFTYWRVYVRAARQDGSLGKPLRCLPWDFGARLSGDVYAYERGGAYYSLPLPGYWVDVTTAAQALGWERLPALLNWRHYFPGARFNEFVLRNGETWLQAMRELYPTEAILTPTPHPTANIPIVPPTLTPTPNS